MALSIADAQHVLRDAGVYTGPIDGDNGPLTRQAVARVEQQEEVDWGTRTSPRRLFSAMQAVLKREGYDPGDIDGYPGYSTAEAFEDWRARGRRVFRRPSPVSRSEAPPAFRYPAEDRMGEYYGPPAGSDASAGRIAFPLPFRLAWNPDEQVPRAACHRLLSVAFTSVFADAARHYGEIEYRRLGLDLWGGCYNPRRKRGGTSWSTHAWGAAFDLDPERNQLRWGADVARFARSEYDAWWRIVEVHGLTSLGRTADYDWMHVQAARR